MKYLIVILISTTIISCSGQNNRVNISINVVDESGKGLPESHLNFKGEDTTFVLKTDFDGKVNMEGLKAGTYRVGVSYVGYYPLKDYSILIDKEQQLNFELKSGIEMDSVDIKWKGGWMTYEEENGKIKSVRIKGE